MVTILDVARKAQVAPSTVSLVTNNSGYVSPATRQRVESAIKRLKYQARGTRSRSAKRHLAIIYTPAPTSTGIGAIALQCIEGIQAALARQRSRPSLIAAHGPGEDPVFVKSLESGQFDGAIIVGASEVGDRYARLLVAAGIPTVMTNRLLPGGGVSTVTADFRQGGYLAASELIRHGHRHLGFIGYASFHWPSAQRLEGHRQALREHGLCDGDDLLLSPDQLRTPEDPAHEIARYAQHAVKQGVTGFALAQSRLELFTAALQSQGLTVPRDVSLVSFDGPMAVDLPLPCALSRVDYDKDALGELAAETLQELIRGRDRLGYLIKALQTRLIPGDSVAPPPAAIL